MSLQRKLARLTSAGPGSRSTAAPPASAPVEEPVSSPAPAPEDERAARITALRARIQSLSARPPKRPRAVVPPEARAECLPFVREETEHGPVSARTLHYDATARHGTVSLHSALDARGEAVALLSLDPALGAFDPTRCLFLDTETTGLSGGTGTLAFLVGLAWFEGRRLRVEQLFLEEPCHEPALLARLAERIEASSALVTYNGKAFDLPLLRSRFVMARRSPPREPPHLDLVHAARRIYGARVDECRLTTLERDVLGFVREDDVPSSEIPARYADFLRSGDAAPLLAVIEHNRWDVIAMAALAGELAARAAGDEASGRFEPSDMAGLARTALRAGAATLATAFAEDAASAGAKLGQHAVAVRAGTLAATIHRRRGDHHATHRLLLEALALAPDDASLHLSLSKLYEHRLRDPARALEHARRAGSAEDPLEHARRLARLSERIARAPMRLPGIE
jgi:uncharacterized protein YprB with RNaseH-like and TPR domain